ncbi:TPA: hypothetical protein N0F65_012886 [Lagenidium giganteum]|uniref:HECT-type E3 ubiquitin transferase n=1 Tax=Lagenidium giganteum TaxID=4803 RepID=A0AAV2YJ00_9STRA|nr:TPA: hypothetical protein N0F65_012886 [Lagenidium giganteum]
MSEPDATARFHAVYAQLLAQGVAPNDAAAQALQQMMALPQVQAQPQTQTAPPPPAPTVVTSPPATATARATATATTTATDGDVHMEDDAPMPMPTPPAQSPAPSVQAGAGAPVSPGQAASMLGQQLHDALAQAEATRDYRDVKRLLYAVFSDIETLNQAFSAPAEARIEQLKWWGVDHALLSAVYERLERALNEAEDAMALQNTLRNALETLVTQPWNCYSTWNSPATLRFLFIVWEHPLVFDPDYLTVVGGLCKLFYHLTPQAKALVHEQWATHFSNDELYRMLQVLQQAITVCLFGSRKMDIVYAACSVLKEIHVLNNKRTPPFATYEEFYNDAVNSEVDIVSDYGRSIFFMKKRRAARSSGDNAIPLRPLSELSFCDFPFVLDAASKSRVLQVDSDLEQRAHAQEAVLGGMLSGSVSPYLILKVHRENIIEDSLQQLVRMSPDVLKRPLKVKFIGEEGIDEGGVQKEFFQILIRRLLDPAFGMFTYDEETHQLWFNSDSLEASMEFELIGILLGLAIYNAVILDLHFPHLVYKKLMNCSLDLTDVEIAMPALGRGLRQLLEFDGNVEETYQRNFEFSYEVFGEVKTVELKPGGSAIPVTNANREEYVSLYVDYIVNTSVAKQYDAFHRGFHLVCNGEVLEMFRWEELHLLICGSPDLDFEALEQVTHYDDGYTAESRCIRDFWSVVHELPLEDKKKLLMFCTGSDRVPIRGLSNMVFVVSRNGSDSDRLPTAHTCFNHLLLPEYSSKEKLRERLLLAINQSEGFGLR